MRLILSVIAVLSLSACGFTPVYYNSDTPTPLQTQLQQVQIANIPERSGQILRNALLDRLQAKGRVGVGDGLLLQVATPVENRVGLGIAKDASITRAQLRLQTSMRLLDKAGMVLLERPLLAVASYNTLGSEFKTQVTETDVREQALNELANQATLQLELFFNKPNSLVSP